MGLAGMALDRVGTCEENIDVVLSRDLLFHYSKLPIIIHGELAARRPAIVCIFRTPEMLRHPIPCRPSRPQPQPTHLVMHAFHRLHGSHH